MVVNLYDKTKISDYISIFAALSFHNSYRSMIYDGHPRNDIFNLLFVPAKIIAKAFLESILVAPVPELISVTVIFKQEKLQLNLMKNFANIFLHYHILEKIRHIFMTW